MLGCTGLSCATTGPTTKTATSSSHLARQRVLMLVDVVVPGWVPFHALGGATDVAGYLDAHDTALSTRSTRWSLATSPAPAQPAMFGFCASILTTSATPASRPGSRSILVISRPRPAVTTSGGSPEPTSVSSPSAPPAKSRPTGPTG